jgi:hypothetical protein
MYIPAFLLGYIFHIDGGYEIAMVVMGCVDIVVTLLFFIFFNKICEITHRVKRKLWKNWNQQ